ncbi:MAG: hypothetical protein WCF88_19345 [Candidatus Acidiferrales bacterium]
MSRLAVHGRRGNYLANLPWARGKDRVNLGIGRKVNLERALSRLGERRTGFIPDLVQVGNVKQLSVASGAQDFDAAGYARHVTRRIEYGDSESVTRGCLLIIADALVNHSDEVWFFGVLHSECELALFIGFCARLFLHSGIEAKQNHVIASG